MAKLKETARTLRPREKLEKKGADKLSNSELLAILLRTGRTGENVTDLSKRILRKFPGNKLIDTSYEELISIKGLSTAKVATLKAAFEFTKRTLSITDSDLPFINTASKAVEQVSEIRSAKREYFIALFLNARSQLIHKETIFMGTVNAINIHPRDVFEPALQHGSISIIVVHNHPSGDIEPSRDDKRITKHLCDAGELLGIELADHVIVAKQGYYSFRESGEL